MAQIFHPDRSAPAWDTLDGSCLCELVEPAGIAQHSGLHGAEERAMEDRQKKDKVENVDVMDKLMDKQTDGLTDGSEVGGGICIAVVYPHISPY